MRSGLANQFEHGSALPGDDPRVGIRVNQRRPGFALHAQALGFARGLGGCTAPEGGLIAFDIGQFGRHRTLGHHYMAGNPARARRQGQCGTVVAGGMCHHTVTGVLHIQRPHRVAGPAELERAAALQVFGLEVQAGAGQCIQRA